jgi:CheY-like chemotaxis protein
MSEEKKPKILLVDDDRFLLDMYVLKFKANNIQIDTSSSSKDTLEKLRAGEKYDVIMLDIIMPNIDGIELLTIIRQEKLCEGSSIIMLTNQADDVEKAKALGVDGYIIKATTIPSEVVETVLNIFKNKTKK